jgi:hypothetical protein
LLGSTRQSTCKAAPGPPVDARIKSIKSGHDGQGIFLQHRN